MKFARILAVTCALLTGPASGAVVHAQTAHRHMVAAANPMAVEAGLETLRRGGSALDAAIVVQMVLGVVEPQASGIGGGGFLLYYGAADRRMIAYDGRETAPAGAGPALFLRPDGEPQAFPEAMIGGASVGVPSVLRLLQVAHKEHGRLPWRDLFDAAIGVAEKGFAVPPRLARLLAQEKALQRDPAARAVYFTSDGEPRRVGDRIVNPALADTMRVIAERGVDAFYSGPIAEDMVRAVRSAARPGTLSHDDLTGYRPISRGPICGPYRQWRLCGMPPPSSGPLAILQSLAMLERFDLARETPNSLRSVHLIAEASRLAFADRNRWVADPAFVRVPIEGLLAPSYLAARSALIDEARAMATGRPGLPASDLNRLADDNDSEIPATSHINVVDRDGNVVSFTTTIEAPFGSRLFVRGFLLNNELTDFSFLPEIDGRTVANRVQPGKRPRSSMSPMVVFDGEGRLTMTLGSAGGPRIIGDVLHATVGVLDWQLSMQEAISLPRVANRNAMTEIEAATPLLGLAERLTAMGHKLDIQPHNGGLAGIRRRTDGSLEGGADPRRDGIARGD